MTTATLGSLGDLRDAVRSLSLDEGITASEAVDRVLDVMEPDDEATRYLVRYGLISLVNNEESHARTAAEVDEWLPRSRFQTGFPVQVIRAFLVRYRTADGRELPLIEFTVRDLRALEGMCRVQARGWAKRARATKEIREAVEAAGVEFVGDLSREKLLALAPVVTEAWQA